MASFTVFAEDHLMMVTNAGKVIRIRVDGGEGDTIRIAGRKTQGVTLFEIDKKELVVSVGIIRDVDEDETDETDDAHDDAGVEQAETPETDEAPANMPEDAPEDDTEADDHDDTAS